MNSIKQNGDNRLVNLFVYANQEILPDDEQLDKF